MADASPVVDDDPKDTQAVGLSRWVPSLPTLTLTSLNPFTHESPAATTDSPTSSVAKRQSFLAGIIPFSTSPANPASKPHDGTRRRPAADSLMFAEPDARSTSDHSHDGSYYDAGQRRQSPDKAGRPDSRRPRTDRGDSGNSAARGRKASTRPKTSFSICHPPRASAARQRLHRRTRSLLQLHRLSPHTRPSPAFEVVPSANFNVRLTAAIAKLYKVKHGLCPNDLVILRAEKYVAADDDDEEEADKAEAAKDIVALICKGKRDDALGAGCVGCGARICLPDGREWDARALPGGGYEFGTVDEHGLAVTARWMPKRSSKDSSGAHKRFNFSTISPNSRRHPVIAGLSRTGLDINDTYKIPDPAAATPAGTPRLAPTVVDDEMLDDAGDQDDAGDLRQQGLQPYLTTDAGLRELILVSSIWVLFKEGWSPSFRYDDGGYGGGSSVKDRAPSMPRSPSYASGHSPTKSAASLIGATPPASPGLPGPLPAALEKRSSLRSISSSFMGRRQGGGGALASQASSVSEEPTTGTSSGGMAAVHAATLAQQQRSGRTRANSQSTVLVHRAASNRTRKNSIATWRPDLLAQGPQGAVRESVEPESDAEGSRADAEAGDGGTTAAEDDDDDDDGDSSEEEGGGAAARTPSRPSRARVAGSNATSTTATDAKSAESSPAPRTPSTRTGTVTGSARKTTAAVKGSPRKATAPSAAADDRGSRQGKKLGWRRLLCGSG